MSLATIIEITLMGLVSSSLADNMHLNLYYFPADASCTPTISRVKPTVLPSGFDYNQSWGVGQFRGVPVYFISIWSNGPSSGSIDLTDKLTSFNCASGNKLYFLGVSMSTYWGGSNMKISMNGLEHVVCSGDDGSNSCPSAFMNKPVPIRGDYWLTANQGSWYLTFYAPSQ